MYIKKVTYILLKSKSNLLFACWNFSYTEVWRNRITQVLCWRGSCISSSTRFSIDLFMLTFYSCAKTEMQVFKYLLFFIYSWFSVCLLLRKSNSEPELTFYTFHFVTALYIMCIMALLSCLFEENEKSVLFIHRKLFVLKLLIL